ncbi:MAG TPA: hypothetical protein VLW06_10685 [Terriglobales bacterium]|nr:hypothetical protein [Terriglobales bacterium]
MQGRKQNYKGFTLITSLILLFLLSALAIGMLMMVNSEINVGSQDVQNNTTFHAAEGAIEKMTADLSNLFVQALSPAPADIQSLATTPGPPVIAGITFPNGGYTLSPVMDPNHPTQMLETPGTVAAGPYAGLNAQLLQVNLQATAQGLLGDEVEMTRTVEIALIPVFQFGAFSDGDLAFFNNPSFTFNGSLHTNGDLYLGCAGSNTCTFTSKMSAYGNIIRSVIPNGVSSSTANNLGSVQIPGEPGGCSGNNECTTLPTSSNLWGSVTGGGGNPPVSSYNSGPPNWVTISQNTWTSSNKYLGGMLINGNYGSTPNTGATNLSLPFVSGATLSQTPGLGNPPGPQNYEIVRRPPSTESATSPLGASRLYNEAAIRVLLSDTPDELPGGASDADNVRLANVNNPHGSGVNYSDGVQTSQPNLTAGKTYMTFFATASALIPTDGTAAVSGSTYVAGADWPYAPQSTPGEFGQEFDSVDETTTGTTAAGFPYLFSNGPSQTSAPGGVTLCSAINPATCNTTYPYYTVPQLNVKTASDTQWNLIDGYLRVEYLPENGSCPGPGSSPDGYCAITREWLGLGFARDTAPPTVAGVPYVAPTQTSPSLYTSAASNDVNPYAILIFQQPKRANTGSVDRNGTAPTCNTTSHTSHGVTTYTTTCSGQPPDVIVDTAAGTPWQDLSGGNTFTAFNWYPINFYDVREGEPDDVIQGNDSCTPMGVMNAVELDVGNLNQWLEGHIAGSGTLVNYSNQNGYVLYFSDRRGMLPNPNGTQTITAGNISGDAGFEDVVNSGSSSRAPDGALESAPSGRNLSPEDANLNGRLDNFGAQNLGLGLGYVGTPLYSSSKSVNKLVNTTPPNPYLTSGRMASCPVATNAWISGARHVLKLVDGSLGNLPTVPGGTFPTSTGGFTVGSENPVYVVGNYNSNCSAAGSDCTPGNGTYDPNWPSPPAATDVRHAAASITADTVTLLSNSWIDWNSLGVGTAQPTQPCPNGTSGGCAVSASANRSATNGGYYRMAIATGDVQAFAHPSWASGNEYPIGTDGGMGNFLRLLETWNNQTLNYNGSMVNLFFSTYNTGLFKCCNYSVYVPPTRNYNFDTSFNTFSELPPGTPMFRDIDNLSYRQSFTPCTVGSNNKCSN